MPVPTGPNKTFDVLGVLSMDFQSMEIDSVLSGFGSGSQERQLTQMSELEFRDQRLRDYVQKQDGNEVMDYHLAVGMVASDKQATEHAVLIVRRSEPPPGKEELHIDISKASPQVNVPVEPHRDYLMIHLHRNKYENQPTTIQLGCSTLYRTLICARYIEFACVRTTRRLLYVLAVKSCPSMYSTALADCYTFIRNYVGNLLNYVEESGMLDGDIAQVRKELLQRVVATSGMTGVSENQTREEGPGLMSQLEGRFHFLWRFMSGKRSKTKH